MNNKPRRLFINFGGIDYWYHNRAHAEVQIMKRLAKNDVVIFINSIGMRTPTKSTTPKPWKRILRKMRSTIKYIRRPEKELSFYVVSPLILPFYSSHILRKINAQIIALQIGIIAYFLGRKYRTRYRIISVTVPTSAPAIHHMRYDALVLHRFDKMSAFRGANLELIQTYEHELLQSADLIIFSSTELLNDEIAQCSGNVVFFDHGVDTKLFRRSDKPEDIPLDMNHIVELQKPIVGFFGGLDDHVVDFDLLEHVAKSLPEISLVLIGDAPRDMNQLISYSNIFWLGKKPLDEIPLYGSHFQVAIMPFCQSSWLKYANPIKLKEYMSLGLPIVSTPITEIDKYGDVFVCKDYEEFSKKIRLILESYPSYSSKEYRDGQRSKILQHDWNIRVQQYSDLVDDIIS